MILTTSKFSLNSNQTLHFKPPHKLTISNHVSRRNLSSSITITTAITSLYQLLSTKSDSAKAAEEGPFDFLRMTVPDQTPEQAMAVIKEHAFRLLQVKELLDSESWKEAQKELRKSSAELKQDLYTIIQGKPGFERRSLRELYTNLFDNVTRLDFAARDKDVSTVSKCYGNIVDTLNVIFSRI